MTRPGPRKIIGALIGVALGVFLPLAPARAADQTILADYLLHARFTTVIEPVAFGASGEQAETRILFAQFRGIQGNDVDQFKRAGTRVILYPPAFKSGEPLYPNGEISR